MACVLELTLDSTCHQEMHPRPRRSPPPSEHVPRAQPPKMQGNSKTQGSSRGLVRCSLKVKPKIGSSRPVSSGSGSGWSLFVECIVYACRMHFTSTPVPKTRTQEYNSYGGVVFSDVIAGVRDEAPVSSWADSAIVPVAIRGLIFSGFPRPQRGMTTNAHSTSEKPRKAKTSGWRIHTPYCVRCQSPPSVLCRLCDRPRADPRGTYMLGDSAGYAAHPVSQSVLHRERDTEERRERPRGQVSQGHDGTPALAQTGQPPN